MMIITSVRTSWASCKYDSVDRSLNPALIKAMLAMIGTNEVTANSVFFDRGTFRVLPLTCFYLPQSAYAYSTFLPNLSTFITFSVDPINVDPICPQLRPALLHEAARLAARPRRRGRRSGGATCLTLHPVSVRRFPSFRTQPLESLTPFPMNKWISEQPSPWRKSSKRKSCYGDRVYLSNAGFLQK